MERRKKCHSAKPAPARGVPEQSSETVWYDQKEMVLRAKTTGDGHRLGYAADDMGDPGREVVLRHSKSGRGNVQKAGRVVNRKTVRRIYKRMGWDEPRRMRAAKVRWMPIKVDSPNEVWETDHTLCLVRSGGWMVLLLQRAGHLHSVMASLPVQHVGHCRCRHRVTGGGGRRR